MEMNERLQTAIRLLKRLEWSGVNYAGTNQEHAVCPVCRAPSERWSPGRGSVKGTHRSDCELKAALADKEA